MRRDLLLHSGESFFPCGNENIDIARLSERFEGHENHLYFGCLLDPLVKYVLSPNREKVLALTTARLMYSRIKGLPDCSRLSIIKVNGDAASF